MYIKEKIDFKLRNDLSIFKEGILESLFVEFKSDVTGENVVIGVMYRPPNGSLREFEEHFEELLDKINKENKFY